MIMNQSRWLPSLITHGREAERKGVFWFYVQTRHIYAVLGYLCISDRAVWESLPVFDNFLNVDYCKVNIH